MILKLNKEQANKLNLKEGTKIKILEKKVKYEKTIVYHGSPNNFSRFGYNYEQDEWFHSFSDDKEVAKWFIKNAGKGEGFLYTVEIKYSNPAEINYRGNVKFGKDRSLLPYIEAENEEGDPLYDALILQNVYEGDSGIEANTYGIFEPDNIKIKKKEKIKIN